MINLQGTEKQIKFANDLLDHLNKYVNTVIQGYEEGKASDDEKETFKEIVEENITPILENKKSWEVITKLQNKNKELWQLEDEGFMSDFERFEGIEKPYNLADEIAQILEELFA